MTYYYIHNQRRSDGFAPERDEEGRVKFYTYMPKVEKGQVVCTYDGDFLDPLYVNGIKSHVVVW